MASESEQGHVDCTVKRRTRLVRITFVGSSVQSLTNSNRRIRNRTYGGVGGADERLSPLSRSTQNDGLPYGDQHHLKTGDGLPHGCQKRLTKGWYNSTNQSLRRVPCSRAIAHKPKSPR